jgi:hypothetical protein
MFVLRLFLVRTELALLQPGALAACYRFTVSKFRPFVISYLALPRLFSSHRFVSSCCGRSSSPPIFVQSVLISCRGSLCSPARSARFLFLDSGALLSWFCAIRFVVLRPARSKCCFSSCGAQFTTLDFYCSLLFNLRAWCAALISVRFPWFGTVLMRRQLPVVGCLFVVAF